MEIIFHILFLIGLMVIFLVILNRIINGKMIKLAKRIFKHFAPVFIFLIVCVIFFTVIPTTTIYIYSNNPEKYLLLGGYLEQIIGAFLLIFYFVTGGIVTYQIIEWDLYKKLNKFFGKVIERGQTVPTLSSLIGVAFIISGSILQIIQLLF